MLMICFAAVNGEINTASAGAGRIVYLDERLRDLIPPGSKLEMIASGFAHIEGPVWLPDSNCLLFSDTITATIHCWLENGHVTDFLKGTGYTGRLPYSEEPGSNGLAITPDGLLLMCEHGDRRIASYPLNGNYGRRTVSDNHDGMRFNSPNDLTLKKDGTIYFTDPTYGLPMKEHDPTRETGISGVYRVSPDGKTDLLISDLSHPNGITLSPDEKTLYVTVSDEHHPHIMKYSVNEDGSLSGGEMFFDASNLPRQQQMQVTDGLKTDRFGNLWTSGPGGLLILDPQGTLLGKVETHEVISNCAWNENESVLFMTAGAYLYRLVLMQ